MFTQEDVIYAYTRKQALDDGQQVEVTHLAREAGIKYPVYLTDTVYHGYVVPSEQAKVYGNDEIGRLWDILNVFRYAAMNCPGAEMKFTVFMVMHNPKAEPVKFKSTIGPKDIDDPSPTITIMMPDED